MKEAKIIDDIPVFQVECNPATGGLSLTENDKLHAIKVLRLKPNDYCFATDGQGGFWKAQIKNTSCQLEVVESLPKFGESPYRLRLLVGMLKHPQPWEWLLEKATELGVAEILPIRCDRTDKYARINCDRSQKVLWAAVKQCKRSVLPTLYEPITFSDWLSTLKHPERHWLANQNGENFPFGISSQVFDSCLIGPEGDFSPNEIQKMADLGIPAFNIGKNRLRSETAAIVALTHMNIGFSSQR